MNLGDILYVQDSPDELIHYKGRQLYIDATVYYLGGLIDRFLVTKESTKEELLKNRKELKKEDFYKKVKEFKA